MHKKKLQINTKCSATISNLFIEVAMHKYQKYECILLAIKIATPRRRQDTLIIAIKYNKVNK